MSGEGGDERTLEETPTWAVGAVCGVFVTIGLVVVFGIDKIEDRLKRARRKPLVHSLQKMKEELMLLGFISLLLAVFQNNLAGICVTSKLLDRWAPCHQKKGQNGINSSAEVSTRGYGRGLLPADSWPMTNWANDPLFSGRILAEGEPKNCKPGHEPFISTDALHQLHSYLFFLAAVHIGYSLCAMLLAFVKVKGWRVWEEEAQMESHDSLSEISKSLSLHRQTAFVKYHTSKPWSGKRFLVWAVCFFRQFGKSVVRSDYLTLRLGFISNHNAGPKFDFHRYMIRSLEDEFPMVVGISVHLWFLAILCLLFNTAGANLFFWLSIVPTVLVLLVGAKLQHIIATLGLENAGITQGAQFLRTLPKPRDELFWFGKPQLILYLIHYTLFQNAFEMATIVTVTLQFGWESCLLHNRIYLYIRIGLNVFVQILCSYSTLPLYALVTQMGSHYKQAIFEEHIKNKLQNWLQGAKNRVKLGTVSKETQERFVNGYDQGGSPPYSGIPMFEDSSRGNSDDIRFEAGPCFRPTRSVFYSKGVPRADRELCRSASAPTIMKHFDGPKPTFEFPRPSYSPITSSISMRPSHTDKTTRSVIDSSAKPSAVLTETSNRQTRNPPDSPPTLMATLTPEITIET